VSIEIDASFSAESTSASMIGAQLHFATIIGAHDASMIGAHVLHCATMIGAHDASIIGAIVLHCATMIGAH